MSTLCSDRKLELAERATQFHHIAIYVPEQKNYVGGILHEPPGMSTYKHGDEPMVSPDGLYDLTSDSWLTVNAYANC